LLERRIAHEEVSFGDSDLFQRGTDRRPRAFADADRRLLAGFDDGAEMPSLLVADNATRARRRRSNRGASADYQYFRTVAVQSGAPLPVLQGRAAVTPRSCGSCGDKGGQMRE